MQEWIEILLRTLSLFILVLFSARILGKNMESVTPFTFMSYIVIAVISALISTKLLKTLLLVLLL